LPVSPASIALGDKYF